MPVLQISSHKKGQRCCPFELADRSGKNYLLQCDMAMASLYRSPSWAFPP
jgi:hypothetical protein